MIEKQFKNHYFTAKKTKKMIEIKIVYKKSMS
ncbi:hypothetical protein N482_03865 [Pseudoalteromonas luteoviolacea NCIMB 1942]|uniref:Uncharacterized protein n=1 Tax=Pseudoalteromonas luteoviolacea NCIMB 1942 TaxID=1365253 RepID=A0A166Y4V7_9GAMM|nr:hypothetical protein N482_03865 [Pseudoalteromonas luteoviolacea NCIMB 1942]